MVAVPFPWPFAIFSLESDFFIAFELAPTGSEQ